MEQQVQQLQNDLAAALAQIQALQQAQAAQAQQQQQQPAAQLPAPQPGPFALTPALASQDTIDYSSSTGIKLYKTAIAPLETLFDGRPASLPLFLNDVQSRATESGWTGILTISNQDPTNPTDKDLITQHRMLSLENVRNSAITNYLGQENRAYQNSHQLFKFLKGSLTKEMRQTMMTETSKFTIVHQNRTYKDGPSFLKAILTKCHVETNATNFYLRESLHDLPDKMVKLKYNVKEFNEFVKLQVSDLAAGGEESSDLLVYLFKAYLTVKDKDFNDHIKHKKNKYDDGTPITPTALMDTALTKYLQLQQSNSWCAPSDEEKQIVALAAQLQKAKQTIDQLKKGNESGSDNDGTKKDKSKKPKKKKDKDDKPAWKKQKPRPGQTTRKHDGETYKWCSFHEIWCNHTEDDCRAKKKAAEADNSESKPPASKDNKSLELAKALVAIAEEDESLHE